MINILKKAIQTKKSFDQINNYNVYTLKVCLSSNKFKLKKFFEEAFKVKVESVHTSRKKVYLKNRRNNKFRMLIEKKAFFKIKKGYKLGNNLSATNEKLANSDIIVDDTSDKLEK